MILPLEELYLVYQKGIIAPWYLRPSQLKFYFELRNKKKIVTKCHRRWGKGTTSFVYIFEQMLRNKIIVRYGAETQSQAYQILDYLIDQIFLLPEFKPTKTNGSYTFTNGSVLHVFGCKDSGEADKARGTSAHIILCDEYAFWRFKPEYMIKSVLSPQLDTTDGQLIITSTPPEDLTHPYVEEVRQASANGYLFNWSITDSIECGEISQKQHSKIIERSGGIESETYKREYLCELIPSRTRLVIPEAQNDSYVGVQPRPDYFDYYVCMDLGLRDFTASLFGYWDFKEARLIVEKESVLNYVSTKTITDSNKQIEQDLGLKVKPYKRIADNALQQLFDMTTEHGYSVSPITKRSNQDDQSFRESVINGIRIAIGQNKILISPECKQTISQLKYGIWKENRTDFQRTETLGHLDALMALAYLWDNIDKTHNPYPVIPENVSHASHYISPKLQNTSLKQSLTKLVKRN
jgi:hypothetical protein